MARKKADDVLTAERVELVKRYVAPGSRLLFVCTYWSRRGYSTHGYRVLVPYIDEHGAPQIQDVTHVVGRLTNTWSERADEIRVTGCGFDKRHHVVSSLARALGEEYRGIRHD